jgi:metaxin
LVYRVFLVETCLLALSERLGESEYFFGSSPTELDALVFGYLFTMLTHPLHNHSQFANLIKHHPNLTKFCRRIDQGFFEEDQQLPGFSGHGNN